MTKRSDLQLEYQKVYDNIQRYLNSKHISNKIKKEIDHEFLRWQWKANNEVSL